MSFECRKPKVTVQMSDRKEIQRDSKSFMVKINLCVYFIDRFRIKAPPAPPRRDRNLDNVIISETKDNSIAKHQVKVSTKQ